MKIVDATGLRGLWALEWALALVVRSISVDPPTPELTAKSSSPRKRVTRANGKMTLKAFQIALS